MRFGLIVDLLFMFGLLWFMYSQAVKPLWNDTKLFPMFSKRRKFIDRRITEAHEDADVEEKLRELEKAERARVRAPNNRRKPS